MKNTKIAFLTKKNLFPYYMHIIKNIPPHLVDIIYKDEIPEDCKKFEQQGFSFFAYDKNILHAYDFWVVDEVEVFFEVFSKLTREELRGKIICTLRHCLDYTGKDIPLAQFSIRGHKLIAAPSDAFENTIGKDNLDLFEKATKLPVNEKTEFAYTGPYNIAEWTKKIRIPKKDFRNDLEESLGCSLPKDKPIVAFFKDELGYEKSIIHGLKKLSEHATIIYKSYKQKDPCLLALGKNITLWPSTSFAPNLLRFASDFILAGYSSGTLSSSIMLGLKVIPYYTKQIYVKGRAFKELGSFEALLPRPPYRSTNHRCLIGYGESFDIENTERIKTIMSSKGYWDDYAKKLPEIQKFSFGDYVLEDSEVKTAKLILRAYLKGSFGLDGHTIKLRDNFLKDC